MNKIKVYKTIVCLAHSRKLGGRCVAGKEIVNDRMPLEITNKSVHNSLLLIKPERLSISIEKAFSQVKIRTDFDFNRQIITTRIVYNKG